MICLLAHLQRSLQIGSESYTDEASTTFDVLGTKPLSVAAKGMVKQTYRPVAAKQNAERKSEDRRQGNHEE